MMVFEKNLRTYIFVEVVLLGIPFDTTGKCPRFQVYEEPLIPAKP